jgi:hypothetical protein
MNNLENQFLLDKLILKTAETLYYVRRSNIALRHVIIYFLEILHCGLVEFKLSGSTDKLVEELEYFAFGLFSGESLFRIIYRYIFSGNNEIALIKLRLLKISFSNNIEELFCEDLVRKIDDSFAQIISFFIKKN